VRIMGRKIPFDNVVRNLERGKYYGKIMQADYSNLGLRLFLERKFADNLGVSVDFLNQIDLLKKQDVAGWNITVSPSVDELKTKKKVIEQELKRSEQGMAGMEK